MVSMTELLLLVILQKILKFVFLYYFTFVDVKITEIIIYFGMIIDEHVLYCHILYMYILFLLVF